MNRDLVNCNTEPQAYQGPHIWDTQPQTTQELHILGHIPINSSESWHPKTDLPLPSIPEISISGHRLLNPAETLYAGTHWPKLLQHQSAWMQIPVTFLKLKTPYTSKNKWDPPKSSWLWTLRHPNTSHWQHRLQGSSETSNSGPEYKVSQRHPIRGLRIPNRYDPILDMNPKQPRIPTLWDTDPQIVQRPKNTQRPPTKRSET